MNAAYKRWLYWDISSAFFDLRFTIDDLRFLKFIRYLYGAVDDFFDL